MNLYFRSLALFLLVFGLFTNSFSQEEEKSKLDTAIGFLFGATDYVFDDFESSDNDAGGKTLNASVSLFSGSSTEVSANYLNKRITDFELEFPEEAKLDLKFIDELVDGKLSAYLPSGLPLTAGVSISNFAVDFGESGTSPKELVTNVALNAGWDILGGFTAQDVELALTIGEPTTAQRSITGEITGTAQVGEIPLSIATTISTNVDDSSITGTIENLSLESILTSVVPTESTALLAGTPSVFKSLVLSNIELSVQPVSKTITFSANSSYGNIIMSYEKNAASDVLVGLTPAQNFKFSELSPVLSPLDQLDFSGSHFVMSSKQTQVPFSFFNDQADQEGDFNIRPGLNLVTSIALPQNMTELLGVQSVQFMGNISEDFSRMALSSEISFNLELGSPDFTFDALTASLVVGKGDFEMSFTGAGSFQAGDDRVELFGGINLDVISMQVGFEAGLAAGGRMLEAPENCLAPQPEWSEPFGIPGVGLRKLAIGASVGTTFPWLNELKFAGNLRVGTVADQSQHICGSMTTVVNIADFSDSMILAEVQNLTILSMIEAFVEDSDIQGSLRDALETGIKSAKFKLIPKEMEVFGQTYSKGLALDSAQIQLLGVNALMGFTVSESGLKAYGSMDPLVVEEGGFTFFAITGAKPGTNGQVTGPSVSLGFDANDPHFKLDGSVTLLEIESKTFIEVNKSGFEFMTEGDILDGAFNVSATVSASDFTETSGLYAKVAFTSDLQERLKTALISFIDEETKKNQKAYQDAKDVLARSKGNNDFEQAFIDLAGETVNAFQEMDKGAAIAGAYIVENTLGEVFDVRKIAFEGSITSMTAEVTLDIDMTIAGNDIQEQVTTSINISEEALLDLLVDVLGEDVIDAFGSFGDEFVTAFEDLGTELEAAFETMGNEIVEAAEVVGEGIITGAEYIGTAFEDAAREVETFFEGSTVSHPISNGTMPARIPPNTTHFRVTVNKIVVTGNEGGLYPALELFGGITVFPFGYISANEGSTPYVYSRSERNSIEKGEGQEIGIGKSKDFYVDNDYITQSGVSIISAMGEFNTFGGPGGDSEKLKGRKDYYFQGNDNARSYFTASDGDGETIQIHYTIQQIERRGPIPTLQQMQAAVRSGNEGEVNRLVNDGGTLRAQGMIESAIQGKASINMINVLLRAGNIAKTNQVELAFSPQYYNPEIGFALLNATRANASSDALLSIVNQNKTDVARRLVNEYKAYPKLAHIQAAIKNQNVEMLKLLDSKGNIPVTTNELQFVLDRKEVALAKAFTQRGAIPTAAMITQAVTMNELELVELMMRETKADQTAMLAAAQQNNTDMFKLLTNRVGLTNNQPVNTAIDNNNMDILLIALKHGGTKNEALQYALQKKNKEAINLTLDKGANPTYAVNYAVTNKDMELYQRLLSTYGASADVAVKSSYDNDNIEMAEMAMKNGSETNSTLSRAAASGKMNWVELALTYNADPNAGMKGAVDAEQNEAVKRLLVAGASGEDPHYIIKASSNQNMAMVKDLVELGNADPNLARNAAISANNMEMLTYLLDKGAQAVGVQIPAQNGWLPMVKLLIERGDDPEKGMPASIEYDRDDVAIYLLDQGADVKDYIITTAQRGDYEVTAKLLEKGADADMGTFNAAKYKHVDIMKLLIDNNADVSKESLMDAAVWNFQYEMAKLLLENGGDTAFVTKKGETYLHRVADKKGQANLVALFLQYGLSVEARTEKQETPLHLAASGGNKNLESVRLLVEAGADVNALDKKSRTVFKRAKGKKVKDYLKEKGAVKKIDSKGGI